MKDIKTDIKKVARQRAELYAKTRSFFDGKGYLEVETPVLSPDLIPESTIDCFETVFMNEFSGSRNLYLVPSPEVYMKKLIASGCGSVYEISKCFRNCEQLGKLHNPEFTMLEYYTVGFDEKDSVALTREYLQAVCPEFPNRPFNVLSVREAVLNQSGLDIELLQSASDFRKAAAERAGLHIPGPESWADTFNRVFCTFVEPSLKNGEVTVFTDYPAQIECLAKRNGKYRRRWELYIGQIEIANCYFEEDNEECVRSYFETEQAKLSRERSLNGKVIPDADPQFCSYFGNFPRCSGVAVGLDRLLMTLYGYDNIEETLLFPF